MNQVLDREKKPSLRISGAILVVANLVPLFGALYLNWSVLDIVFTYWFENLVIGFVNILRMATAGWKEKRQTSGGGKGFLIPFFTIHYFGFCLGHVVFIFSLLGKGSETQESDGVSAFWIAVLALFLSHLYSFFRNYLGRGEYKKANLSLLMFAPYPRIVVLHLAIIFGAMGVEKAGEPTVLLVILVVGKIVIDLAMHWVSHAKSRLLEQS